jgi:hypothetical protein
MEDPVVPVDDDRPVGVDQDAFDAGVPLGPLSFREGLDVQNRHQAVGQDIAAFRIINTSRREMGLSIVCAIVKNLRGSSQLERGLSRVLHQGLVELKSVILLDAGSPAT